MADDATVVAEQVIWADGDGNVTDDKDAAVSGEVLQELSDGTTRSTLFEIESR